MTKWLQVTFTGMSLGRLDQFIKQYQIPHIEIYPRSWFLQMSPGMVTLLEILVPGVMVLDVISPGMQAHIENLYAVDSPVSDSDNPVD